MSIANLSNLVPASSRNKFGLTAVSRFAGM